jgi:hypothetical protein
MSLFGSDVAGQPIESATSGVLISAPSRTQVENLYRLGKVWGFLKYHHPRVAAGELDWDRELFVILPKLLAQKDLKAANQFLAEWIQRLGDVAVCQSCRIPSESALQLRPPVEWIYNEHVLGTELSQLLQRIYVNRFQGTGRYVRFSDDADNATFDNEQPYSGVRFPDPGFQLLALFRLWNAIEFWSPYRGVIGTDWDGVLRHFIPRMISVADKADFEIRLAELATRVNDTHSAAISPLPHGNCWAPVRFRYIGRRLIALEGGGLIGRGDEILAVDGKSVASIYRQWAPVYPASNETARRRNIARNLPKGACGNVIFKFRHGATVASVEVGRRESDEDDLLRRRSHERPGSAFQMLTPTLAYMKVSAVDEEQLDQFIADTAQLPAWIIDLRAYPTWEAVTKLRSSIAASKLPYIRWAIPKSGNPGAFEWSEIEYLQPNVRAYGGKVYVLVDEATQSRGEFLAMILRAAPNVRIVGSTTAGADGNVSTISIPGGFLFRFSGLGVFYPDFQPTQRIGIIPDFVARPTARGVRDGVDEVLAKAVKLALGKNISSQTARQIASVENYQ